MKNRTQGEKTLYLCMCKANGGGMYISTTYFNSGYSPCPALLTDGALRRIWTTIKIYYHGGGSREAALAALMELPEDFRRTASKEAKFASFHATNKPDLV